MAERQLTDWIETYLTLTENSEPSRLYREWVAISVIAAVLQRKCYSDWDKMIFPNMYIILVGPSGARKGTAMNQGYNFLTQPQFNVKMAAESTTREALIRRLKKHETTAIPGAPMAHSSLTIYSEEFAVFIGQNNLEFISNLTDWFDCKSPWRYETKTQGEDTVNGIWVNLLGATTPAIIKSVLPQDAIGGGLTSRIIFVYAPGKEKVVPYPMLTAAEKEIFKVLSSDLEQMSVMAGEFKPTQEFAELYGAWYIEHSKNPPFHDEKFEGYNERRQLHLRKVAMIMSASRDNSQEMTAVDFHRALALLKRTERLMPKVFSAYGRLDTSGLIDSIMGLLTMKKEMTFKDLLFRYRKDLTREELEEIMTKLSELGFCSIKTNPAAGTKTYTYIPEEEEKDGEPGTEKVN
jgi:hypothetical protein